MKTLTFTADELKLLERALKREGDNLWDHWSHCEDNGWVDSAEKHYKNFNMCEALRDRAKKELIEE